MDYSIPEAGVATMVAFYRSLLCEAFIRTYGFGKAQEFGLTLLLAILGIVLYLSWKKYWDKERTAMKDWKALLVAAIGPIILVCVGRLFWNASVVVFKRHQRSEQTITQLESQTEHYQLKVANGIDQIEKENYPKKCWLPKPR